MNAEFRPRLRLGDHDAFVSLQTLAGTFLDLDLDDDGVAGGEGGDGLAEAGNLFLLELLNQISFACSCKNQRWPLAFHTEQVAT